MTLTFEGVGHISAGLVAQRERTAGVLRTLLGYPVAHSIDELREELGVPGIRTFCAGATRLNTLLCRFPH